MSENKKIVIVHSAAPYEDAKKAAGIGIKLIIGLILIALILVGLIIYAVIKGIIFLATDIIWPAIYWGTYPIWYPISKLIKKAVYVFYNFDAIAGETSLSQTTLIILLISGLILFAGGFGAITEIVKSIKKGQEFDWVDAIFIMAFIIGMVFLVLFVVL